MPQAQAQQPAAQPQLTPEQMQRSVNELLKSNPRAWNPQTIQQADISELILATSILDGDRPEFSRQLLPSGMTLEQFDRMLNREISRRGAWPLVYETIVRKVSGLPLLDLDAARTAANFTRASFDYPQAPSPQRQSVMLDPSTVAIYDNAIQTLFSNQSGFQYYTDTARAAGLPPRANGRAYAYNGNTDVANKRQVYAFAALSEFNPSNPNAQITATATVDNTPENIQAAYCQLTPNMYEAGRSLQPRDAGVTGFLEGRIDARNGFAPREANYGITGPCPTPAAVPAQPARRAQR